MDARRSLLLIGFAAAAIAAAPSPQPPASASPTAAADVHPVRLAGSYDGHQMEMAAGLELLPDGRFRYALSYGALDEEAQGKWEADGGQVLLTSDRVVPPRFVVLETKPSQNARLKIVLDVPGGMSRQYFDALVFLADGTAIRRQLSEKGLEMPLGGGPRPVSVAMLLPVFEVRGQQVRLPRASGGEMHFRFEPHDLGKVAFARTPLRQDHGGLVLERYDRTIIFRRVSGQ